MKENKILAVFLFIVVLPCYSYFIHITDTELDIYFYLTFSSILSTGIILFLFDLESARNAIIAIKKAILKRIAGN